jgi:hypothetical protein
VLWPCGHTLCEECVTRAPAESVHAYGSGGDGGGGNGLGGAAAAAGGVTPGALVTICTECRYNFDHPVTRDDDDETSGNDGMNNSNNSHGRGGSAAGARRSAASGAASTFAASVSLRSSSLDGDDVSFPNPFFDPPANFHGAFYAAPNVLMAKLVDAYEYEHGRGTAPAAPR